MIIYNLTKSEDSDIVMSFFMLSAPITENSSL